MIKIYNFSYDFFEADASFKVDTAIFTSEMAQATLDFFMWDYNEAADPVDEVMKKYAMEAIRVATINEYNTDGVISEFKEKEGFASIDGSLGIELMSISGYELQEDKLDVKIKTID